MSGWETTLGWPVAVRRRDCDTEVYEVMGFQYSALMPATLRLNIFWGEGSGVTSLNPWASSRNVERQINVYWNNVEGEQVLQLYCSEVRL